MLFNQVITNDIKCIYVHSVQSVSHLIDSRKYVSSKLYFIPKCSQCIIYVILQLCKILRTAHNISYINICQNIINLLIVIVVIGQPTFFTKFLRMIKIR